MNKLRNSFVMKAFAPLSVLIITRHCYYGNNDERTMHHSYQSMLHCELFRSQPNKELSRFPVISYNLTDNKDNQYRHLKSFRLVLLEFNFTRHGQGYSLNWFLLPMLCLLLQEDLQDIFRFFIYLTVFSINKCSMFT